MTGCKRGGLFIQFMQRLAPLGLAITAWHFMFAGQSRVPLTLRCIIGKGWGQGPQHSQSLHTICSHFPGLRVALPSSASQAKGLLLNSIFCDDPVVLFEARPLFDLEEEVPEPPYLYPLGKAKVVQEGSEITVVAISYLVESARKAVRELSEEGISVELIDLVSSSPVDYQTVCHSVKKTGRLIVLDISWGPLGLASEISAEVNERLFGELRSSIVRMTLPFYPAPTSAVLEGQYYLTVEDIVRKCKQVLKEIKIKGK